MLPGVSEAMEEIAKSQGKDWDETLRSGRRMAAGTSRSTKRRAMEMRKKDADLACYEVVHTPLGLRARAETVSGCHEASLRGLPLGCPGGWTPGYAFWPRSQWFFVLSHSLFSQLADVSLGEPLRLRWQMSLRAFLAFSLCRCSQQCERHDRVPIIVRHETLELR